MYGTGRPIAGHSKSGRFSVWFAKPDVPFSDISILLYTVNVRIPDVRFGKQDRKSSGFRMSGYQTSGSIQIGPVIGRLLYLKRLKSERFRPDFRQRQLPERSKSGQYCPDFRQIGAKTGSKPVWNRFRHILDQNECRNWFQTSSKLVWNRF